MPKKITCPECKESWVTSEDPYDSLQRHFQLFHPYTMPTETEENEQAEQEYRKEHKMDLSEYVD